LDNNTIIEETLGDLGFICLDDLIHELSTNGENFDKISGFLVPFRFSKLADKKSKKSVVSSTVMEKQTPKAKSEFINRILMRLN
jgi:large subunit ribosomal protein L7e